MKIRISSNIALFLLLLPVIHTDAQQSQKPASAVKLMVNPEESRVNWIGKKPGGEHHGYVRLSGGEILLDNTEIRGGSFTFDMNSITDTDLTDESFRTKLIGHLKSADFFDVQKYPAAKFVITRVNKIPAVKSVTGEVKSTHTIEGNLTMKDITKKISFGASVNFLKGKLTATSLPFTIDRTQWGVNYQSKSIVAGLKDQYIFDEISLTVDLVTK
jgi:polyisoprenoid-binding protein YceI